MSVRGLGWAVIFWIPCFLTSILWRFMAESTPRYSDTTDYWPTAFLARSITSRFLRAKSLYIEYWTAAGIRQKFHAL